MDVNVTEATQHFVAAPVVPGYRIASVVLVGSWNGLPVLSAPMQNGCRIIAAPANTFSVSGSVVFSYVRT